MLETADDRTLAGRAADGDTAAFTVLMRRYAPLLRAYVRRLLPGTAEVDDAVQDAFVTAWQRLPQLADPGKVKAWLMRIAGRAALTRTRRLGALALDDSAPVTAPARLDPARVVEARAGIVELGHALDELPAAQRACWVLREHGGYPYADIAAELDLPLATVRGLLARARAYLLTRMEAWR
ncbi:RNA polymerase sigma factor [Leucobacter chromiireducens]|uniref:RNA polymerase sigma factor n=1 Tax=Leucobacter chromiireducens TaxID=283877 RepID=UPI000F631962|nr:RNA polymerase sigma factor [Leucobacter chromiireducens]